MSESSDAQPERRKFPKTPKVGEEKVDTWNRLRDDFQWEAASEWMVKRVAALQQSFPGRPKKDLRAHVWAECALKFPPKKEDAIEPAKLPAPPKPKPKKEEPKGYQLSEKELDALLAGDTGTPVSFKDDLVWVYAHAADYRITLENCPSSGAFWLLEWARKQNDKFMALYAKAMDADAKSAKHDALGDDGREQLKLVTKLAGEGHRDATPV